MIETKIVKGYELREVLGRGGYGAVYQAYQPTVERDVAIKVILPEYASQPEFIRQFEVEAQTVARLEHPFIVPLFDYWRDPEGAYLVMRLVRGGSLLDLMRRRGLLTLPEVHRYLKQMGSALAFAHRARVVHRDLKPANILIDEDDNTYLSDFGISKVIGQTTENNFDDDRVVGSPGYISPEQIQGGPITPRTDIYSLGVMLFEMISGKHPYRRDGENVNMTHLIYQHLQEPLPSLSEFGDTFPYDLDLLLARATEKNAENRFADVGELVDAFEQAIGEGHAVSSIDSESLVISNLPVENPYKGLRPFDEADAADFYGREKLVGNLAAHFEDKNTRFLAVVGPSGSGKSSVVRAGLIPALRDGAVIGSENWYFADMVPSTDPLRGLLTALESVAAETSAQLAEQLQADPRGLVWAVDRILAGQKDAELFLMIDQFEEVFTLAENETEREHFLQLIYTAVTSPDSRLRVLVTLRADFYDRPLLYNEFGGLVQQYTHVVLPLGPNEIERAITMPAARVGVAVDTDLIAAIVDDVREEPGALPLLQYALTELFEMREANRLTLVAYEQSGGVVGALARRAEDVYQNLPASVQATVRQIFLRLITLGEGREDTRRRVSRSELASLTQDRDQLDNILNAFGRFRLLTFDRDPETREPMVEVAHEALIREWRRLQGWLGDMRGDMRLQRVLAAAATEWMSANRDFSYLMRGGQLAQFEEWYADTTLALTEVEHDFLQSSMTERQREQNRQDAQRQRETRQRRWLGRLSIAAVIVALIAGITAALAFSERTAANRERDNAQNARATSEAQALRAEQAVATANVALSQAQVRANELESLALISRAQALLDTNPPLSLALGVAANRVDNTPSQAFDALYDWAYAPGPRTQLGERDEAVLALASYGGMVASGGSDGVLRLWDLASGEQISALPTSPEDILALDWSDDGSTIISGSVDGVARLWNAETGRALEALYTGERAVHDVALSNDGALALTGADDGRVVLWDTQTGKFIRAFNAHEGRVRAVTFSSDDTLVLSGGDDDRVLVWDTQTGDLLNELEGHNATITSLAFLRQNTVVSGSSDGRLIIWDLDSGLPRRIVTGHTAAVWDIAPLRDGGFISVSGGESLDETQSFGEVTVWRGANGIVEAEYRAHEGSIRAATTDGDSLVTASTDGSILVWSLTPSDGDQRHLPIQGSGAVAIGVLGNTLVSSEGLLSPANMTSVTRTNTLTVWDLNTNQPVSQLIGGHSETPRVILPIPGTNRILTGGDDGRLLLWDVDSGEILQTYDRYPEPIWGSALNADGTRVATVALDQPTRIWDVASGALLAEIEGFGTVRDVAWHPDGQRLVLAGEDLVIWDNTLAELDALYSVNGSEIASVDYSPDGLAIAYVRLDGIAAVVDSETGMPQANFDIEGRANHIRFNPTGQQVATASTAGVQLWDARTGNEIIYFTNRAPVWDIAFSDNGAYLWAASQDGNIRQYPASPTALADWAEENRYLPTLDCQQQVEFHLPQDPACAATEN